MPRIAVVSLLLALFLAGCPKTEDWSAGVNTVLARRERAFNEHNLQLYMSAVSRQYGEGSTGYAQIRSRAEALFGGIDSISYTSSGRSLYQLDDGRIMAVQRYAMELKLGPDVKSLSGQEKLYLDPGDGYRIVDGL